MDKELNLNVEGADGTGLGREQSFASHKELIDPTKVIFDSILKDSTNFDVFVVVMIKILHSRCENEINNLEETSFLKSCCLFLWDFSQ